MERGTRWQYWQTTSARNKRGPERSKQCLISCDNNYDNDDDGDDDEDEHDDLKEATVL